MLLKGMFLPSMRLLESPFLEPLLRTLLRTLGFARRCVLWFVFFLFSGVEGGRGRQRQRQ